MREKHNYYASFKRLITTSLEDPIEETFEYQTLHESFPHLTESIRLQREKERLKRELKLMSKRSERLKQKRMIYSIETKLRKENVLKRLYGEKQREILFKMKYQIDVVKEHTSVLWRSSRNLTGFFTSFRKSLLRKMPPVVHNLRSLDLGEAALDVREWVQRRQIAHNSDGED